MRFFVPLLLCLACTTRAGGAPEIRPGVYSGPAPDHIGFLQIELYPDGTAIFRRVVTMHLPPAELETKRVSFAAKCVEPAPETIERCAVGTSSVSITIVAKPGGQRVRLEWKAEVEAATAPEAKSKGI